MQRRSLALAPLALLASRTRAQATRRITIRARVPEGSGTVYIAGNLPELGPWDPGQRAMDGLGPERRITLDVPAGQTLEFKLTLGSWAREGLGPQGVTLPNFRVAPDAEREISVEIAEFKRDARMNLSDTAGSGVLGTLSYWHDVPSRHLKAARHVGVWLPPSYAKRPAARFPVLYMHDGQNLFDPRIAFGGIDWGVDEAVMRLAAAGRMPEAIVIGVWSTADRAREYSPWHDGPAYGRFLVEELMPEVNAELRTRKGPGYTTVLGSSMGGLISFDLCRRYPHVFGAGGCIAMHVRFAPSQVNGDYGAPGPAYLADELERGLRFARGPRLWIDHGTVGLDAGYPALQAKLAAWLRDQGWREGSDFVVRRYEGSEHSEAAWRARLDDVLAFLYRAR